MYLVTCNIEKSFRRDLKSGSYPNLFSRSHTVVHPELQQTDTAAVGLIVHRS